MRLDEHNLPVDITGDGGDSAHFAGVMAMDMSKHPRLAAYARKGILVRHPHDVPWNNPKNFTRDQLISYIGGCAHRGYRSIIRSVFWKHVLRFGFCQNSERDYVGSTKYPWPHKFHRDSDPNKPVDFKWFDSCDFLTPANWIFLLKATNYSLFKPIVWAFQWIFTLELYAFCRWDKNNDETNMIMACYLMGPKYLLRYSQWRKGWKEKIHQRWVVGRDMQWAADTLTAMVGSANGRTAYHDSKSTDTSAKDNAEAGQS